MDPSHMGASALALVAAVLDWRNGRIPNWVNATGVVTGLIIAVSTGSVAAAVWGLLVALLAAGALYLCSQIGGGDAKLMVALGAFLGPWQILPVMALSFVAGAFGAIWVAHQQGALRDMGREFRNAALGLMAASPPRRLQLPRVTIRFAPFIAAAVLLVCWWPAFRALGQ